MKIPIPCEFWKHGRRENIFSDNIVTKINRNVFLNRNICRLMKNIEIINVLKDQQDADPFYEKMLDLLQK